MKTTTDDRFERGMATLRKIDPEIADTLMDKLRPLAPDLARLTIEVGFGEIMSRETLDLRTRELVNVGMLGAMGNAADQLRMHVRGARNTGASRAELIEVVLQIAGYAGFPAAYNALKTVAEVFHDEDQRHAAAKP